MDRNLNACYDSMQLGTGYLQSEHFRLEHFDLFVLQLGQMLVEICFYYVIFTNRDCDMYKAVLADD